MYPRSGAWALFLVRKAMAGRRGATVTTEARCGLPPALQLGKTYRQEFARPSRGWEVDNE
jgi:hypothetical protein